MRAGDPLVGESGPVDLARDTFDFMQYASKARSVVDLQRRFDEFVRQFGYRHACCVEIKAPGGLLVGEELFGHVDPGWHERYFTQQYSRHDAVLSESIRQEEPFFWTDIARRRKLLAGEQRVLDEVREFSSYEGFSVPIHNLDGSLSIVSLFGDKQVDRSPDTFTSLHIIGLAYGGAARRLKRQIDLSEQPPKLTNRQAEIVRYIATGHRVDEIAERLSISVATVRSHLADAKKRYNAATLAQLAVECVRNREFVL